MDRIAQTVLDEEPIGIVISRGSRSEATPRFSAYEWWPGPGDEPDTSASNSTKAA